MTPVGPPALRPGDRVAVLAPSSPVFPEPLGAGLEVLRSWGYDVVEGRNLRARHGHLAGPDGARGDDLARAIADPAIRAVFAGRGGYGSQRLVDLVDWDRYGAAPTLLVGFSDFTALLHAAWRRAGVPGIHGQFVGRLASLSDAAVGHLRALLAGDDLDPIAFEPDQVLVAGVASGPLVGGNLSMVTTNLGTTDELSGEGEVLFLEDVNEPPYAIDRMLTQLRRAGLLQRVAAVVVGGWRDCDPPADRPSATAEEVVADRLGDLGVPVVTGLPIGHTDRQLALPHGTTCQLDTRAGALTLQPPVAP